MTPRKPKRMSVKKEARLNLKESRRNWKRQAISQARKTAIENRNLDHLLLSAQKLVKEKPLRDENFRPASKIAEEYYASNLASNSVDLCKHFFEVYEKAALAEKSQDKLGLNILSLGFRQFSKSNRGFSERGMDDYIGTVLVDRSKIEAKDFALLKKKMQVTKYDKTKLLNLIDHLSKDIIKKRRVIDELYSGNTRKTYNFLDGLATTRHSFNILLKYFEQMKEKL